MSKTRILAAAALLGLVAGAAYAENQANPPPNPTVAPQGSGQGMMGGPQMMGGGGKGGMVGEMGKPGERQAAREDGIVGISPAVSADAVGATASLIIRHVASYSPAYYAGITSGDQIVAVDGQPVDGKSLNDVAAAIRGEVGTAVKLRLSRDGQSREVSLTRVEPVSGHEGRRHMGEGGMMGMRGGMMGMRGGMNGMNGMTGMNGMMGMMGHMGRMMEACNDMMQNDDR
jgi:membrane-associated protease RseP (regulator of RpoE activity)